MTDTLFDDDAGCAVEIPTVGSGLEDWLPPAQLATLERLFKMQALLDVNAARLEQVTKWGHSDESDANEPVWQQAKKAHGRIHDAVDILRSSNPDAKDRLTTARAKLVKGLALGLAAIDRIDAAIAAQQKQGGF